MDLRANKIPIRVEPPETMAHNDYGTIRAEMERKLACLDKVNRYAVHESGHLIYLIKTGLISGPNDATFDPPTIYLDDGVEQYSAAVSSVHIRLTDNTISYTEELLDKISLVSAAASEFEKALLGTDEDTKKAEMGDRKMLYKYCIKARQDDIEFEGKTRWSSAQRDTKNWIQENRTEADKLVSIAKQIIFKRCFQLTVELTAVDLSVQQQHCMVSSLLLQLLFE